MSVIVALVAGFLAGRVAWFVLRGTLESTVFLRENYRHHRVPTAGGLVVVLAVVVVEAIRSLFAASGVGSEETITTSRLLVIAVVVGFSTLGLADDLGSAGNSRGFRGHLAALQSGRLTTGGLKLIGGSAVALIVAGPASFDGIRGKNTLWHVVVDALVIALSANLVNLFDRAPGRSIKVSTLMFSFLVVGALVTSRANDLRQLVGTAVVLGAALAVLLDDLHERLMIGDTGSNAIGAAVGLSIVFTTTNSTRLIVLLVLLLLNTASEFVSFSALIDSFAPFRAFDRLGTRAERRSYRARSHNDVV